MYIIHLPHATNHIVDGNGHFCLFIINVFTIISSPLILNFLIADCHWATFSVSSSKWVHHHCLARCPIVRVDTRFVKGVPNNFTAVLFNAACDARKLTVTLIADLSWGTVHLFSGGSWYHEAAVFGKVLLAVLLVEHARVYFDVLNWDVGVGTRLEGVHHRSWFLLKGSTLIEVLLSLTTHTFRSLRPWYIIKLVVHFLLLLRYLIRWVEITLRDLDGISYLWYRYTHPISSFLRNHKEVTDNI